MSTLGAELFAQKVEEAKARLVLLDLQEYHPNVLREALVDLGYCVPVLAKNPFSADGVRVALLNQGYIVPIMGDQSTLSALKEAGVSNQEAHQIIQRFTTITRSHWEDMIGLALAQAKGTYKP